MAKNYYLIFPTQNQPVITASNIKFTDHYIYIDAINHQTGEYVNTQYIPITDYYKIVKYTDLAKFKLAVAMLLKTKADLDYINKFDQAFQASPTESAHETE